MLQTVTVPPKHLDDYADAAGPEAVERLREAARPLRGARVLMLNSTAYGGGVAELLITQVPLLRDLGIDVTWAVLEGSEPFFAVTKSVHNALQGAEVDWDQDAEAVYGERVRANADQLSEDFDVWFVHDPQPAAIVQAMEERGRRSGRWLWRCHIDLSTPFPPVWDFFLPLVDRYDAAVFTMEEFAQPGIAGPRLAFIPPSIDPLSDKNMSLGEEEAVGVLARYGVDPGRPLVTQVSRFDPWKDPIGVIDAYRLAREEVPGLQLALAGSMADDDPEGRHYLGLTEERRDGDPDIHLLTNLDGVGNLEVNAFQSRSEVVIQKSIREGFGLVVAEAMWKRTPVVGGAAGGIRLQIEDGRSGFLVDSPEACAKRTVELLRDPGRRRDMGETARTRVRERFLTLREMEDYLRLIATLP